MLSKGKNSFVKGYLKEIDRCEDHVKITRNCIIFNKCASEESRQATRSHGLEVRHAPFPTDGGGGGGAHDMWSRPWLTLYDSVRFSPGGAPSSDPEPSLDSHVSGVEQNPGFTHSHRDLVV